MLEKYRYNVFRCTRCGLCRQKYSETVHRVCPTREHTGGFEPYFSRGLLSVASGILEKELDYSPEFVEVLYACLTCQNCTEQCASVDMQTFRTLIDTGRIVREMREDAIARGLEPKAMQALNATVSSTKTCAGGSLEDKKRLGEKFKLPQKGKLVYFSGCDAVYPNPEEAEATIKILQATGADPAYLGDKEWCSGATQYWAGNTELAKELALHNIEALTAAGAKTVVTSSASCLNTLKKVYPELAELDELPFEVIHLSEYLAPLVGTRKLKFKNSINKTVTYHDPCQLGRHAKIYDAPRKVIESIPGIKLKEMERIRGASWCCGSGIGVVKTTDPDLALSIATDRHEEAQATGAEILTSACPTCIAQLKLAGSQSKSPMKYMNLPALVAEAMGV